MKKIILFISLLIAIKCNSQTFGTTDIGYSTCNKITGSMTFGYKVNNFYAIAGSRFHITQKRIPANFSVSIGSVFQLGENKTTHDKRNWLPEIMIDGGYAYVFNLLVRDRYFSPEHDTVFISDGYKKQAYIKPIGSIRVFVYKELYVGYSYCFNTHYFFTGVKFDL